jgi:bacteriocin biosynthesis cyclodehydratase domain-containing protein
VRCETADNGGEDLLVFTSEGRRVALRGHAFPVFVERVVPLLDGRQTLEQIQEQVSDALDPNDLARTLELLREHGVVADADAAPSLPGNEGIGPELGYLHEIGADPALVLDRLRRASVAVFGLGPIGAVAATALAAAGVGQIRCVDSGTVSEADPYLAQLFGLDDVGRSRAEVARLRIGAVNPTVSVEARTEPLHGDEALLDAIEGSDFALGCLDPELGSLIGRLNRACLALRVPWATGTATAFEGVVGPTIIPYETACYRCYQARVIAGRDDPAGALAELREREQGATDMSAQRENLPFGAGVVGSLLALQAFQLLTGLRPATLGRVLVVDFRGSRMSQHLVLRKPWCPDCFAGQDG